MAIEFDRTLFARINFTVFALTVALVIFAWNAPAFAQGIPSHPGAPIYKQAGCITCHKWHGMGGSGYGGTPINFRQNFLTRDQLIEVIAGQKVLLIRYRAGARMGGISCGGRLSCRSAGV